MIRNKEKLRQVGGLLLEALMLVFVFTCSFTAVHETNPSKRSLTFSVTPTDQIVFRDSDAASETLLSHIAKIHVADLCTAAASLDGQSVGMASVAALSIARLIFNPFYTHITASAP